MKATILRLAGACLSASLALASLPALSQANIEKLKQMKVATTDLNIPPVPQGGANADAIRANLKRVKLPPGFKIDLYAIVPDARHMAVAPSTNMLFVGTRKTTVWAVTDRNSDGIADEVKEFKRGDELLARFFFIQDPDGYKIEMLERYGHYQ